MMYPKSINNLIEAFKYFPGVGEKTAERMAFHILGMENIQTDFLADAIKNAKTKIKRCKICNHITEEDICYICEDKLRNKEILCVVEDPKTVISIEKLGIYNGYYHVLNGLIQTLDGINPEDIRLDKLIKRIEDNKFKEIIIAVKPCLEGEMTALYINNVLNGMNIEVSRLASGIPMGADMEYIDPITLEKAFDNRKKLS
ncbi:MAG: recombination protein RecR [Bacilli bacterium]|nr:recombination protein RecR [Bacilli bacterium]